jgi:hypothetical protein
LDDAEALVTVIDADRIHHVSTEIERTSVLQSAGLGLWRVPGYYNSELTKGIYYRPILGGHFGAKGGLVKARQLIEAFLWYWRRGNWPSHVTFFGIGKSEIMHRDWPNYGFDEWFQMVALYPRFAKEGILTFLPADARSQLLPLDIEYVTWANPNSEIVYF